jgi:hypothetical protein
VQGTRRDSEGAGVRPARKVPTQSAAVAALPLAKRWEATRSLRAALPLNKRFCLYLKQSFSENSQWPANNLLADPPSAKNRDAFLAIAG